MGKTTELAPLKSSRFFSISHTAETGSTNADLLALAKDADLFDGASAGSPKGVVGTVLLADHQTAGRGRQNRSWHDDPGNALLVSVLLCPDRESAPVIPFAVGMAAVDAVSQIATSEDPSQISPSRPVGLKWPNDVLAQNSDDRKLAGILAESTAHPVDSGKVVVVAGMGLNLRWSQPPPVEVVGSAITLEEILEAAVERNDVLYTYLAQLEKWLRVLETDGPAALVEHYRSYCLTLGRKVRFVTSTGEVSGTVVDVKDDGALKLKSDDQGQLIDLYAGDAHHLGG